MSFAIINGLRRYLPLALFFCNLFLFAIGLVTSSILRETLWQTTLAKQTLMLFMLVAIVALATSIFCLRFRRQPEIFLLIIMLVLMIFFCGVVSASAVLFFLLSSWCFGAVIEKGINYNNNDPEPIVTLVTGWAGYAILFSILASIPINSAGTHLFVLGLPILLILLSPSQFALLRSYFLILLACESQNLTISKSYISGLIVITMILSLHLGMVALPERYYDAMLMHLYMPSYIFGHQVWGFDANSYAFAYMPAGADMLYSDMFMLGGETSARLLNFAAFLLTCVSTFVISIQIVSRSSASWSLAVLVSIPLTLIESSTLFVENTVALFITVSILLLTKKFDKFRLEHYSLVIVLMAGASVVKLHGAIAALPICAIALVLYLVRHKVTRQWAQLFLISLIGVVIAIWPYAHAWLSTGNPLFPLFNQIFKSPYYPPVEFVDPRWSGKLSPWILYDATFSTNSFVEAGAGALGFGFILFLATGISLAALYPNKIATTCGVLGIGLIGGLITKTQYLRYLTIFFPLIIVLVAISIEYLFLFKRLRIGLSFLIGFVLLLNIYKLPEAGWIIGGSDLRACCSEGARRDLEILQAPERIINRLVNELAGSNARVLYINNPYGGLLTGNAIYTTWHNTRFQRDFSKMTSDADFSTMMAQVAPTHVVFDTSASRPLDKLAEKFLTSKATIIVRVGRLVLYQI